jgi:outer membrane lipoprotein-sorting protein
MRRDRTIHFTILAALCLIPISFLSAVTPEELLAGADVMVSFHDSDLSAEYLVEKRDPGGAVSTTRAAMFRRDKTDQFLILILEPTIDKGKGYLKQGETLWLYDPVGRTFTFTSAQERFQNSSARNSDFSRQNYAADYRVLASRQEKLGKFDCTVLDLEARHNRVSFPKVTLWISADMLIRKAEDYSLSGQLMRVTAIPTYQKVNDRWLPLNMVIQDQLRAKKISGKMEYERTSITISKPSLKPLPDMVYTKEYLERVAR